MLKMLLITALLMPWAGAVHADQATTDTPAADTPTEAQTAKAHTIQVDDSDNNKGMALRQGDTLVVRLVSNASAGFSWVISQNDPKLLAPVGKPVYESAPRKPGGPPIVGASGHQVFTFQAQGGGDTVLALEYKRPWEKKQPPAKTFQLKVALGGQ